MLSTFIIEGPDNSGKTTLATTLAKRLNMPVVHQIRPANGKAFLYGFMSEHNCQHSIFDRSMAISQKIYDKLLGRDSIINHTELDLFIDSTVTNLPVIICLPPPNVVCSAVDREEMDGVAERRSELYELYSIFAKSQIGNKNVVVFDYTIHTVDNAVEWLYSQSRG